MTRARRLLCATAVAAVSSVLPAGVAWAHGGTIQSPTTGQPGTTAHFNCATSSAPVEPGNAGTAPGSAFNESTTSPGTAGTVYAGNGTGSTTHAGSTAAVAQYDTACRRLSS